MMVYSFIINSDAIFINHSSNHFTIYLSATCSLYSTFCFLPPSCRVCPILLTHTFARSLSGSQHLNLNPLERVQNYFFVSTFDRKYTTALVRHVLLFRYSFSYVCNWCDFILCEPLRVFLVGMLMFYSRSSLHSDIYKCFEWFFISAFDSSHWNGFGVALLFSYALNSRFKKCFSGLLCFCSS